MVKIHLKIVTLEKQIIDEEVDEVVALTQDGQIGVLPHHAHLMAQLSPGELKIKNNNQERILVIGSGLLQVADNDVVIATDLAQFTEDIDEDVVEEAKKRAEAALEQTLSDEEYASTLAILEKSIAQLKVKRRYRTKT